MKVLIIRLSSIGDIILTTPVLKELKLKYPEITIDFLVMDRFKEAILGCSYIDNLIIFDKKKNDGIKNMINFGKKLKINGYDYVFDLHSKIRSKIISKSLGVKTYSYKKRGLIKTILVKLRLMRYKVDSTIIKSYFGAFKNFNLEYNGENLEFVFEEKDIENLEKQGIKYKNVPVIAPGASKYTKRWTKEGFSEFIEMLYEKYNEKPIIIGGENEFDLCEDIKKLSGDKAINLAGKLSLKESGALLSKAKFLLTNDTGPFHIARGVKCPTFVIFGPTSPEMFEYDDKNILIYLGEKCSPCSLHGDRECPKKHFNCMKKLTSQKVKKIIENSRR